MKHRLKLIARTAVFLLLTLICIEGVQHVFGIGDYSIYSREQGFVQEKKDSLDGVYIGASHVFSFFQPPLAWNDHGIAVFSYAIPSMPAQSLLNRVIEARKTQPDALMIINLNTFKTISFGTQAIHRSVDYMPWSLNKLDMMDRLMDRAGFKWGDRLEYYFPVIRFHSGWSELDSYDFTHSVNGLKGAYTYKYFLQSSEDQTDNFDITEERADIQEEQQRLLDELLDYLKKENVNVLFVTVPQAMDQDTQKQFNTIEDIVREEGFPCLDLMDKCGEIGIQQDTDFHDSNHINVHGSIKFTEYLSQYLIENYGFTDKRGQAGYESWDKSVEIYADTIDKYTLDLEREHRDRDYGLAAPKINKPSMEAGTAHLTWKASKGADEYLIYRKSDQEEDKFWTQVGETTGDVLEFDDSGLTEGAEYTYTVVPARTEGDTIYYGRFSFSGVSKKA